MAPCSEAADTLGELYRILTDAATSTFVLRRQIGGFGPELSEALRAIEKARRIIVEVDLATLL